MKLAVALLINVTACLAVLGQTGSEKSVADVHNFETNWLTAILNSDTGWIDRFNTGKLTAIPADASSLNQRMEAVNAILDPALRPDEMKVRITGTINLLTSDPAKNRSFNFLDTFNKKNGKWQVIATSISPADAARNAGYDRKEIEEELARLENEWAQVDVTNDRSIFDRIIPADFVATGGRGVLDHDRWLKGWEYEGVKSAVNRDIVVHIYSETLAVVTGIDVTTRTDNGKEIIHEDRFTDTWLKRGDQWQVIAAHVTRLK